VQRLYIKWPVQFRTARRRYKVGYKACKSVYQRYWTFEATAYDVACRKLAAFTLHWSCCCRFCATYA